MPPPALAGVASIHTKTFVKVLVTEACTKLKRIINYYLPNMEKVTRVDVTRSGLQTVPVAEHAVRTCHWYISKTHRLVPRLL